MAKNTISQEILTGTPDSYTRHEGQSFADIIRNRPIIGEVDKPSPVKDGGDFSQSSESDSKSSETTNPDLQPPAPTTDSPSKVEGEEFSTVDSTDGNGPEMPPQPSDEEEERDEDDSELESEPVKNPARKTTTTKKAASKAQPRMSTVADDDFDDF